MPRTLKCLILLSFALISTLSLAQINVKTEMVKNGPVKKILRFTGETAPFLEAYAAADVMGPVASILVENGQKVEKNQTLAVIDEIRFEIALRMAEAKLERAKQQLVEDQRDFERNKTLFDKGAITQKAFDKALTVFIQAKTSVKQAQADYDKARLDLNRCSIKSPIAGYFVDRSIELGQAMNRGQNMGRILFLDMIYVEAKIAENDIRKIKIGQKCIIEDKYPGEISFINFAADKSRAFTVRIKVNNPDLYFKANMFVRGSIILEQYDNAPLFSSRAIRNNRGELFVYTIENLMAKRIPIEIIAQEGEKTYAKPVQSGMEIVTVGQDNLNDGSKVITRNGK